MSFNFHKPQEVRKSLKKATFDSGKGSPFSRFLKHSFQPHQYAYPHKCYFPRELGNEKNVRKFTSNNMSKLSQRDPFFGTPKLRNSNHSHGHVMKVGFSQSSSGYINFIKIPINWRSSISIYQIYVFINLSIYPSIYPSNLIQSDPI